MLILYAVKTHEGYVRGFSQGEVAVVGIHKASVYTEENLPEAQALLSTAQKAGMSRVRLVTLELKERDPLLEDALGSGSGA